MNFGRHEGKCQHLLRPYYAFGGVIQWCDMAGVVPNRHRDARAFPSPRFWIRWCFSISQYPLAAESQLAKSRLAYGSELCGIC